MASTNPARGMRDFLPADVRKRNYVIGIIKEVYESYGFEPLETPAVENIETLLGKYGEEGNQLVFKILKRGEKLNEALATGGNANVNERALSDLALRYDLTVPLARVVANNKNNLPKFFKRYQIQPVWRADRPARGRFREFYQCDVDAIGSESMVVEAELIGAVNKILTELGFTEFKIRINNRKVLTGILEVTGIPRTQHEDALVALDKWDKIGLAGVQDEFKQRQISLNTDQDPGSKKQSIWTVIANKALKSLSNDENNTRLLATGKSFIGENIVGLEGMEEVEAILSHLSNVTPTIPSVCFDPSLARGLSYYTGTIMEITVPDLAGSLGGGGRYDGLIGMFGKEQIPACGFSLGLERILVVMEERGMFPPEIAESTPADVMVTMWSYETVADSLKLANELRGQGLRVTLYPEADKLGKQFKYADSIKVPFVCVVGDEEKASGKVKLKNMTSGEEWTVKAAEVSGKITK